MLKLLHLTSDLPWQKAVQRNELTFPDWAYLLLKFLCLIFNLLLDSNCSRWVNSKKKRAIFFAIQWGVEISSQATYFESLSSRKEVSNFFQSAMMPTVVKRNASVKIRRMTPMIIEHFCSDPLKQQPLAKVIAGTALSMPMNHCLQDVVFEVTDFVLWKVDLFGWRMWYVSKLL